MSVRISRRSLPAAPAVTSHALRQLELQLTQSLDRGDDRIARLEPHLLVLRLADDHALGRAGEDDITRLEGEIARRIRDELPAVEHHVGGVRGLARFAVDAAFDLQAAGLL